MTALMLCGCSTNKSDDKSLDPRKALSEASSIYEQSDKISVSYCHSSEEDSTVTSYNADVYMSKMAGVSHAEVTQALSNGQTTVFNSKSDIWMSDNGNGDRYYYVSENGDNDWQEITCSVTSTLYYAGDVAGYLLDQNAKGYTAVDSYYKNGIHYVTAKVGNPLFMSVDPTISDKEASTDEKWDVVLELKGLDKTPLSVKFTRGKETIFLKYTGFDIDFEPVIPALQSEAQKIAAPETEGGD